MESSDGCKDSPEFSLSVLAGETTMPREEFASSEKEQQHLVLVDLEVHRQFFCHLTSKGPHTMTGPGEHGESRCRISYLR